MKQFSNKGKTASQGKGKTWSGKPLNSKPSNGKSSNGKPSNGKPSNGKQLTDWDSYISKEIGISKTSSGKNNGNKTIKSKSKSAEVLKVSKGNKVKSKVIAVKHPVIMNLFYMATEEYTCKQIVAPIVEEKGMEIQIWPDLGIASIEFGESSSIDFTECEFESFDSESDIEFLKEHGVKSIYEVNLAEEDKGKAANWFLAMIQENGGFFCTDSDDFAPIYNKEELERWK